jgi:carboxymethylenebutenolidase
MSQPPAFTADEQQLHDVWNEHLRAEFSAHSADEAIATMGANPRVNQVPVMIGGDGQEEVYEFYAHYFLPQIPPDIETVPVSRTIGQGRLVDEMVLRFTHTIPMDFMLPGIPLTGKPVEVALVVVVQFDGDKMAQRAPVLGPGLRAGAAGAPAARRAAGRRGRGGALRARSEHTAQCADSPRQGPLIASVERSRSAQRRRPANGLAGPQLRFRARLTHALVAAAPLFERLRWPDTR